jgi:steroid delta-isomerase-like uncharacterized protein
MKSRSKKPQPSKARAGKRRAVTLGRSQNKNKAAARRRSPARKGAALRRASEPDVGALARRWFEELWNKRNGDALPGLMDPAATGDTEGGSVTGYDEFYQKLHAPLLGAFPDLRVTIDGVIAQDNQAAVRWTLQATHGGDTLGLPATNRRVSISGITWLRYKNGKVVAGWDRWNANGLMAYLRDGTQCATVRMPA